MHLFRHIARKFLAGRQPSGVVFVQSDEKSDCASAPPALYGIALREENNKKRQEAENKEQQMYKLMEIMLDNYNYYYDRYEDLQKAFGHNAEKLAQHFRDYGMKEGRQVTKYFDLQYYLQQNPDIEKKFGGNYEETLIRFLLNGVHEGRQASPYFDEAYYAENYPDTASLTPYDRFVHFLTKGQSVGRFGSEYDKQTKMEEARRLTGEA